MGGETGREVEADETEVEVEVEVGSAEGALRLIERGGGGKWMPDRVDDPPWLAAECDEEEVEEEETKETEEEERTGMAEEDEVVGGCGKGERVGETARADCGKIIRSTTLIIRGLKSLFVVVPPI
jgi:hypothetical protein